MEDLERLRYPVGRYVRPTAPLDDATRVEYIKEIEGLPAVMRSLVSKLSDTQLDKPYRPGGWTIRQVVHHVPDSHMNMYMRMKLAVTETAPTIKPYNEDSWAQLEDGRTAPVDVSLDLLDALHRRWVLFLRSLKQGDFEKTFIHPEMKGPVPLYQGLALYAWHGKHHAAHIRNAL
jgi:DinB family protein